MTLEDEAERHLRELTPGRTTYIDEDQLLISGSDRTIIINPSGKNIYPVPVPPGTALFAWTADKKHLVGVQRKPSNKKPDLEKKKQEDTLQLEHIIVTDIAGRTRTLCSRNNIHALKYSAVGNFVTFIEGNDIRSYSKNQLYSIGLDDSMPRLIAENVQNYDISPTGQIYYYNNECKTGTFTNKITHHIYCTDVLGSAKEKIKSKFSHFKFVTPDNQFWRNALWIDGTERYIGKQKFHLKDGSGYVSVSPSATAAIQVERETGKTAGVDFRIFSMNISEGYREELYRLVAYDWPIFPCWPSTGNELAIFFNSGELHLFDPVKRQLNRQDAPKEAFPTHTKYISWRPR